MKEEKITTEYIKNLAHIVKEYELETLEFGDIKITRNSKHIHDSLLAEDRRKEQNINQLGKNRTL